MSTIWTINLPECEADGIDGDRIELRLDGRFSINGYDGLTRLTPERALELAAALTEFAALGGKQDPAP